MEQYLTRKSLLMKTGILILLFVLFALPSRAFADSSSVYTVKVKSGFLALRTAPAYDDDNIIGELYTGDVVSVVEKTGGKYWWVYSPKYHCNGYVNKNYLDRRNSKNSGSSSGIYRVVVNKGFLALRTAPAYDDDNIIGELYTGDTVSLISRYNKTYWWVYSPKYDRTGYVNRKYLEMSSSGHTESYGVYTVSVSKGFLALRTAPAYDDGNIIGELYTGDKVNVLGKPDGTYWWFYSPKYGLRGYVNKNYLY